MKVAEVLPDNFKHIHLLFKKTNGLD